MERDRVRGIKWGDGKRGIEREGSKEKVQKSKRGHTNGGVGEKMKASERSSTKDQRTAKGE